MRVQTLESVSTCSARSVHARTHTNLLQRGHSLRTRPRRRAGSRRIGRHGAYRCRSSHIVQLRRPGADLSVRRNDAEDAVDGVVLKKRGAGTKKMVRSTATCETTLGRYNTTHQHLAEVFTIRRLFRCRDGALYALSAPPDLLSRLGQIELQRPEVVDDGIVGFADQDLGRERRRRRDGLTGAQELFAGGER